MVKKRQLKRSKTVPDDDIRKQVAFSTPVAPMPAIEEHQTPLVLTKLHYKDGPKPSLQFATLTQNFNVSIGPYLNAPDLCSNFVLL